MTRKELLKTLFPEADFNDLSCDFVNVKCNISCAECRFQNYWNEPVSLSKSAVKSILNSIYGCNAYFDTDSTYFVFADRGAGKTYARHLELINEGWEKLPSIYNNLVWSTLKAIIDDALDNGFEVRILNGTIYYREKQ